jgi:hypothetical protein
LPRWRWSVWLELIAEVGRGGSTSSSFLSPNCSPSTLRSWIAPGRAGDGSRGRWRQTCGEKERADLLLSRGPQEAAAEAGLELADGVHPLQLASYVEFMGAASGFESDAYSVTLPPYPSGDPAVDWGPELDAQALGRMAIGRVLSGYPIEAAGLRLEDFGRNLVVSQ